MAEAQPVLDQIISSTGQPPLEEQKQEPGTVSEVKQEITEVKTENIDDKSQPSESKGEEPKKIENIQDKKDLSKLK